MSPRSGKSSNNYFMAVIVLFLFLGSTIAFLYSAEARVTDSQGSWLYAMLGIAAIVIGIVISVLVEPTESR